MSEEKIHVNKPVIVEGKYDKIKLESLIDGLIITTDGFRIYKDEEKLSLIRAFACNGGVILLTDSDGAGFQIRNHLKSCIGDGEIINIYVPDIFGKEKRKEKPSKEGKLGVEGIDADILRKAFLDAGVLSDKKESEPWLTKAMLLDDGLVGGSGSGELRKKLAAEFSLPERISANALIEVLNRLYEKEDYEKALIKIKGE